MKVKKNVITKAEMETVDEREKINYTEREKNDEKKLRMKKRKSSPATIMDLFSENFTFLLTNSSRNYLMRALLSDYAKEQQVRYDKKN